MVNSSKPNLLFLCTGNSCRSQMAEGWARQLHGDKFNVYSAGTVAQGLNPLAVRAMAELGVSIAHHHSKTVADLTDVMFDYVVTVCDHARQRCPLFPGQTRLIHQPFDDPPQLAASAGTELEALGHYLHVCDQIRNWVTHLPSSLT
ncbi:arsenate reductase ArsC [Sedimenticola sp.]|uniref:arsenate reductase ArsC n=1 Tax=Sedimenticola sp. TaxID=1940285 RepID=UPI003D15354C